MISLRLPALVSISDSEASLSVYHGNITQENFVSCVARIRVAFPDLDRGFYQLLKERIREKGFSDQRLTDAVNHVIDTCPYPTPTLANFLSFDKRVKLITYQELCTLIGKGEATMDAYERMRINGKVFFVRKDEKRLYNLPNEL
jgi:hypothetical protein